MSDAKQTRRDALKTALGLAVVPAAAHAATQPAATTSQAAATTSQTAATLEENFALASCRAERMVEAVLNLDTARAWYRQYPRLVTSESYPPEFAEALRVARMAPDASGPGEVGPADPNFDEECRGWAANWARSH